MKYLKQLNSYSQFSTGKNLEILHLSNIPPSMHGNMTVAFQEYPALKSEMPLICPATFKRVNQRLLGLREGQEAKTVDKTEAKPSIQSGLNKTVDGQAT